MLHIKNVCTPYKGNTNILHLYLYIIDNLIQCGINIVPINLGSLKKTLNINETNSYRKFINTSYYIMTMKYVIDSEDKIYEIVCINYNDRNNPDCSYQVNNKPSNDNDQVLIVNVKILNIYKTNQYIFCNKYYFDTLYSDRYEILINKS